MTNSAPGEAPRQGGSRNVAAWAARVAVDFLLLAAAYAAASRFTHAPLSAAALLVFTLTGTAAIALLTAYRAPFGLGDDRHLAHLLAGVLLAGEIGCAISFFTPGFAWPLTSFALATGIALVIIAIERRLEDFLPVFPRRGQKQDAAIVVGVGDDAVALLRSLQSRSDMPYRVVGFVDHAGQSRGHA